MQIDLIVIGKLKEKYWRDAVAEYSKRLSRFCKLEVIELPDAPDGADAMAVEAKKILPRIQGVCVPLCVEGEKTDSEGFARFIADCAVKGQSHITFIIGGSSGLDNQVKAKANWRLSFSDMTFPHQLMRVVLLEQLYRAFKINANESYHK